MTKPILFAVLLGVITIGYFALGERAGDLDSVRSVLARLEARRTANALMLAALFFAGYVVIPALSLPLAPVMTLGAGAQFGFWQGLVVVSVASTIGATLAFLAARTLMHERARARLSHRASAVDAGPARDGVFHLFTPRLIPIMPFFAVDLLKRLTPIPAHRFYIVSQAGILAGTAVYANAGTRLAEVDSLSGIFSPARVRSFALLDLFPWIARMFARYFGRRRAYARWTRPKRFDRYLNVIVIGAGAAGLVAYHVGAATGAEVTLIEAQKTGGDCLNFGCVPSKALIASAKRAHKIGGSEAFGLEAKPTRVRFDVVKERVHRMIAEIAPHDSVDHYTGLGVEVLEGYAKIVDSWTVEIARNGGGTARLATRAIIVATGARPFVPPLPGIDAVGHLTSDTLWEALRDRDAVPRRMVVLGGGPIGSELPQSFARLDEALTRIEMAPRVLIREDEEVSALVKTSLEQDGVTVVTDHEAVAYGVDAGEKWIEVTQTGETRRIGFDELIVAVGRALRLAGFGLDELGVETNAYLETLYLNIPTAGDVARPYQFTQAAGHQASFAAANAMFGDIWRMKADYRVIPWATFTGPEVARVGLSEAEARAQGIAYEVTRYDLGDLDRAIADGTTKGLVKVLTAPGNGRILGVSIVGAHAGDRIAEYVLAMKQGLGLGKIHGTLHIYPTLAAANKYTADAWRRAHLDPRLLSFAEGFHRWRLG